MARAAPELSGVTAAASAARQEPPQRIGLIGSVQLWERPQLSAAGPGASMPAVQHERAEGDLTALLRSDRNLYQQVKAGEIGGQGYEGGHLIGSLFGGAGEKINLVPQLTSVNRGDYRAMERAWAEAIRDGKQVKVEVSPVYAGAGQVPAKIEVKYWIDGRPTVREFKNTPG